jgi:hypothetical protein
MISYSIYADTIADIDEFEHRDIWSVMMKKVQTVVLV